MDVVQTPYIAGILTAAAEGLPVPCQLTQAIKPASVYISDRNSCVSQSHPGYGRGRGVLVPFSFIATVRGFYFQNTHWKILFIPFMMYITDCFSGFILEYTGTMREERVYCFY